MKFGNENGDITTDIVGYSENKDIFANCISSELEKSKWKDKSIDTNDI